VRVALIGSSTAVTVATGSRHSGDAPWPIARARAATKRRGGVELEFAGGNEQKWEGGRWAWWAARKKMEKGKGGPAARELAQLAEF
jgi:hypothetical protein